MATAVLLMVQNFTDKADRRKGGKNRITCRKGTVEAAISAAANGGGNR